MNFLDEDLQAGRVRFETWYDMASEEADNAIRLKRPDAGFSEKLPPDLDESDIDAVVLFERRRDRWQCHIVFKGPHASLCTIRTPANALLTSKLDASVAGYAILMKLLAALRARRK